jgi:hypothetical protein
MRKPRLSILTLILLCSWGCPSAPEKEPSGPIARFGVTPTIDGGFGDGEWDDAAVVQAAEYAQFRIKHDGKNLYLALAGDMGNLWFSKETGLHVLHKSAQLASVEYTKAGSPVQYLVKPYDRQLSGLPSRPAAEYKEKIEDFLKKYGWVAGLGGTRGQLEFAVSFDWLELSAGSRRFIEVPGLYIVTGRHFSQKEIESMKDLSLEERMKRYPTINWPNLPEPDPSVNAGNNPETIKVDPTGWGRIWIDLRK